MYVLMASTGLYLIEYRNGRNWTRNIQDAARFDDETALLFARYFGLAVLCVYAPDFHPSAQAKAA